MLIAQQDEAAENTDKEEEDSLKEEGEEEGEDASKEEESEAGGDGEEVGSEQAPSSSTSNETNATSSSKAGGNTTDSGVKSTVKRVMVPKKKLARVSGGWHALAHMCMRTPLHSHTHFALHMRPDTCIRLPTHKHVLTPTALALARTQARTQWQVERPPLTLLAYPPSNPSPPACLRAGDPQCFWRLGV